MSSLRGKKILLAVTGSIAVYKSLFLTRLLIKEEAEVKVIMTKASCDFVSPLSFSTLSKNSVYSEVSSGNDWNNHVELGLWADLMLVAPCTATTLSKMANGIADNMVVACYLSAKCPVFIAPAMDLDMWIHPSTVNNISKLEQYGNKIITVANGELASGLVGEGRMQEPENIIETLAAYFIQGELLKGKKVLITAGPTYEDLDPVRYIGNRSTGKMGIALAESCIESGAEVYLVIGPTSEKIPSKISYIFHVRSAEDMKQKCLEFHNQVDLCIFSAAVADYKPSNFSTQKIKKKDGDLSILLERTSDIAKALGENKKNHQIHIGFALETENEDSNANGKLARKNFDMIVLNSLNDIGAGFGHDTNKIKIFTKDGLSAEFPLQSKKKTADCIIETAINRFIIKN